MRIYRTTIVHFLYGYETWSVTLMEEHRPELFENRVLRKISWDKKQELAEVGENCIMSSCMICTPHQILFW